MPSPVALADLTGVILAGGRGSRMGGVDKGRQTFRGEALAVRAARRLTPQVAHLLVSANRHLDDYRQLAPVVTDTLADFPGPLAGILAALHATTTPFLVCVPCDTPFFPTDLVARLAAAFTDPQLELATACAPDTEEDARGALRSHPVFALMRTSIAARLDASLRAGERRLNAWRMHHNAVEVPFPDGHAFYNVNTLQALDDAG
ncbi:molybdenum cofactor guanylyltransferase MobA [Robbsia sp. Bb-Pol-6]|uniref:Molybdenum cofactor guanylyltransferase n=1 Tax=Robbsia betulipollinis TaxID=2981849 RepID=A0ABT3ZPW5_9BURK|nr:molybdenum cofactor guanylyltransferase MobA [Robbsia betulipollinis]MCY0388570.1 molybdenum cofactor guanylyltransferase MobA [Robbsia betulipollinis]